MIAVPLGEIRLAVATLRHLVKFDQADRASLNTAFALIDEHLDEIDVLIAADGVTGVVQLPILTLAGIGRAAGEAAAARRAALTGMDGGRP